MESLCCISGFHLIKDEAGRIVFRARKNRCISCRGIWGCTICIPFTYIRCFMPYLVTSEACQECRFPLWEPYTVPVRLTTQDVDVTVAKIRQFRRPWCEEAWGCKRLRYNVHCK